MSEILYTIFISPVENIVEFIFYFMNKIFADKPAISIVFVSLAINLLILPLYKRADAMQERERDKVKSMERWNNHIRKTFKGDERYMMQTAYYRIEGYKPLYAITGSLSLLFQIPFFIAAYHFLSNLDLLSGVGFWLINDLGAPDGIIHIGSLHINFLPILMTGVNIVSGFIYTKGFKLKDKLQLYIMALLFLVLLYQSPSGLVLYWTCNNLFSLFKNIFFKLVKHKRLAVNTLSASAGTVLFVYLVASHRMVARRQYLFFALIMLLSYLPALISLINRLNGDIAVKVSEKLKIAEEKKKDINLLFWLGALVNTVILGVMLPAELILTSPTEFGTLVDLTPLSLVLNSAAFYFGFFIVWLGIFYAIANDSLKKIFAYCMYILPICSLVNYYFFYGKFGTMNHLMKFVESPVSKYNDLGKIVNLLILLPVVAVAIFVAKKWSKVAQSVLSILLIMTAILGGTSMYKTHLDLLNENFYETKKINTIEPTVQLSKTGKNVIVFMLDRAISEYVPYIFKELPDVAAEFEDFVYYPNTISYGGCTNFAAPALYGGYEYTPTAMNERTEEALVDKYNEALKMLPVLFEQNGYGVDVVDPPYANFKAYPDPSIFDEYENIDGYATLGKYSRYEYHSEAELIAQKKHLIMYSLFRTAPVLLQNSIYDDGNYLGKSGVGSVTDDYIYCAESYATLDYLHEYSYIEGSQDRLLVMTNNITHEPSMLQLPDYSIGDNIEYPVIDEEFKERYEIDGKNLILWEWDQFSHYDVNAAAYKLLAKFFAYLKEQGIYDNTRIIIVSDHGWPVNMMDDVLLDEETSIETFNPVLLVKDFADSDELIQGEVWHLEESNLNICDTFMTNADVATLCTTGTIENPVNPFTGKTITNDDKNGVQLITSSQNSDVNTQYWNAYKTDDHPWIEFTPGDVKDQSNWNILYPDK